MTWVIDEWSFRVCCEWSQSKRWFLSMEYQLWRAYVPNCNIRVICSRCKMPWQFWIPNQGSNSIFMERKQLATIILDIKDIYFIIKTTCSKNVLELWMPLNDWDFFLWSFQDVLKSLLLSIIQHDLTSITSISYQWLISWIEMTTPCLLVHLHYCQLLKLLLFFVEFKEWHLIISTSNR